MESADDRVPTTSDGLDAPPTGDALDECRRELADKNDRLLRALAEADNIRRRAQRDREEAVRFAAESLVRDLIPVLDNLDRALEKIPYVNRMAWMFTFVMRKPVEA